MAAYGVTSGLICIAAVFAASAGPRPGFFSPGLAPRSPQVMLYLNHSIGAGSGGRPTFGLKVDQLRQVGDSGDPESGDVMQHRELVNWQMEAHSNMHLSDLRVQLGHRVTYDVTNRAFGSPASRQSMPVGMPSFGRNEASGASQPKFGSMTASGIAAFGRGSTAGGSAQERASGASVSRDWRDWRDTMSSPQHDASSGDNSAIREIAAAAVSAMTPSRFASVQRQLGQIGQRPVGGAPGQPRFAPQRGGINNAN